MWTFQLVNYLWLSFHSLLIIATNAFASVVIITVTIASAMQWRWRSQLHFHVTMARPLLLLRYSLLLRHLANTITRLSRIVEWGDHFHYHCPSVSMAHWGLQWLYYCYLLYVGSGLVVQIRQLEGTVKFPKISPSVS